MPRMKTPLALITTLALLVTLVSAALALSEPAYVKAANKICAERTAKLSKLPRVSLKKISSKALAARLRKVIAVYGQGTGQLRALKAPRSFSLLVPRWLHYEDLRIEAWRSGLQAARQHKKGDALRYIGKSNLLARRAAEISTGLEIEHCE
jgi:hypothetical protein